MNDEKKYLIFCWGTIILFVLLIFTITLGGVIGFDTIYNYVFQREPSQGFLNVERNIYMATRAILFLAIIISCGSALYFGNRPSPMIERKN